MHNDINERTQCIENIDKTCTAPPQPIKCIVTSMYCSTAN